MSLVYVGGLASDPDNPAHRDIICYAINNNLPIHSCLKYGKALQLIRTGMDMTGKKPNLLLKVYVNSQEPWLLSSIDYQLEQAKRLLAIDKIMAVQLCCNPKHKYLESGNVFRKKLQLMKSSGVVKKIFLEVYWQYSENMEKYLHDRLFDGYTFYHNIYLREMNARLYREINKSNKEIITIRSLGINGPVPTPFTSDYLAQLSSIFMQSGYKSFLDFNIAFVKSMPRLSGAVCGTTKLNHYLELLEKFERINPMEQVLRNSIVELHDLVWAKRGVGNGEGLHH